MVDYAARRDFVTRCRPLPPAPWEGAVAVYCAFFMPHPTSVTEAEAAQLSATHERIGDSDKLIRNVLDALKSAGVYRDDVLVDDARGVRVYAVGQWRPGAHVRVTIPALCAANRRRNAELAARDAMLRTVQGVTA
jgi:Holliday junction resolvase RusA-like endonuclease